MSRHVNPTFAIHDVVMCHVYGVAMCMTSPCVYCVVMRVCVLGAMGADDVIHMTTTYTRRRAGCASVIVLQVHVVVFQVHVVVFKSTSLCFKFTSLWRQVEGGAAGVLT
jgi:hypothetical protein